MLQIAFLLLTAVPPTPAPAPHFAPVPKFASAKRLDIEQHVFRAGVEAGRSERQAEIETLKAQLAEVRSELNAQLRVTWDGRQWVQLDESMTRISRVWTSGAWVETSPGIPDSDTSAGTIRSACDRGGCPGGVCYPKLFPGKEGR